MNSLFNLSGRTALVTGANTGIGQAIAVALAMAGADVIAAGRLRPDATSALVAAAGRRFEFIEVDLADSASCPVVMERALAMVDHIDILVNNAGTIARADCLNISQQDWDSVLDLTLKSVFFLSQAAARHMTARGSGKIINIALLLSFQGSIGVAAYTASKSALVGLTRAMANELAVDGANAIEPGYIEINNTAPLRADRVRAAAIIERIPAGRWGQGGDLGGPAVFLASEASAYVNGNVLPVDGGWLAR